MEQDIKEQCKICGGAISGHKCDVCEVELPVATPDHECGEEHRMAICARCGEVETKCDCEATD